MWYCSTQRRPEIIIQSGKGKQVGTRVIWAFAFAVAIHPLIAQAAAYNLNASGSRQSRTGSTTCGAALGDTYDTFCPSDPVGNTSCECQSFSANVNGNLAGAGLGTLNVTVDNGIAVDTPDCQPFFGELIFAASGDNETIYLNGSHCNPQGAGGEAVRGGWGIFSSSKGIKAFGTLVGTRNPDHSYSLTLSGGTQ
jgi:hypothetical protein